MPKVCTARARRGKSARIVPGASPGWSMKLPAVPGVTSSCRAHQFGLSFTAGGVGGGGYAPPFPFGGQVSTPKQAFRITAGRNPCRPPPPPPTFLFLVEPVFTPGN